MAFQTDQPWRVLNSGYTGGRPEQGDRRCFADGLGQSLVSSVKHGLMIVFFSSIPVIFRLDM